MRQLPVLDDVDIAAAEASLGLTFQEEEQRRAFVATSTLDVHAVPGNGKTTLLAAKLLALARRWGTRPYGVCVLSHTNVAHREVSERLAPFADAGHFLRRPHFVGTFQQFAHQFLAMPRARRKNLAIEQIDDDGFAVRAARRCQAGRYATARQFLSRQHDGLDAFGELEWLDADLTLGRAGRDMGVGTGTATFKQLKAFKDEAAKDGYFRFRDMFALALRELRERPRLREILIARFALVVVDEVQDTEPHQFSLLDAAFGTAVPIQRLGDTNQRIYTGAGGAFGAASFPRADACRLRRSQRFGAGIATVASRVTLTEATAIEGSLGVPDVAPALFLYEGPAIELVMPAFAAWAVKRMPEIGGRPRVVKAVGVRVRSSGDENNPPRSVADYWASVEGIRVGVPDRSPVLADYALAARAERSEITALRPAVWLLRGGVERALRRSAASAPVGAFLATTDRGLRELDRGAWLAFRHAVRAVLHAPELSAATWHDQRCALLQPFVGTGVALAAICASTELAWVDEPVRPAEASLRSTARPVYLHAPDGDPPLGIEVTSIHAVKGETHDATLVLETKRFSHDLELLLPLLTGERVPSAGAVHGARLLDHSRAIFVAATRPRFLLAFAAEASHVRASTRAKAAQEGWEVIEIRAPSAPANPGAS